LTTVDRLGPGSKRDVGLPIWIFSTIAGRVVGTAPPNLFLTLGRRRKLFWGWLRFARHLMPAGTLPRRETEMVILRVAELTGCEYERTHHLRMALRSGLNEDDCARVAIGSFDPAWSERDRILLGTVEALIGHEDLTDQEWSAVAGAYDQPQLVELVMLVTHYRMLATIIRTLDVQPDVDRRDRARMPPRLSR
jgi:AhpD family alkylhydroperoxidase